MNSIILKALTSVCALATFGPASAAEPQIGRCLQGDCIWTRILNKTLIERRDGASLYRVEYQEGIASLIDKEGHSRKADIFSESAGLKEEISWYSSGIEYVFCSKILPIVMRSIAKVVPLTESAQTYGRANILSVYAPSATILLS